MVSGTRDGDMRIGRCWLKKLNLGQASSSKGSKCGQKSCGVTGRRYLYIVLTDCSTLEDDPLSGHIIDEMAAPATAPLGQQRCS